MGGDSSAGLAASALDFFGDSHHPPLPHPPSPRTPADSLHAAHSDRTHLGKRKTRETESNPELLCEDNTQPETDQPEEGEGEGQEDVGMALKLFAGHTPASLGTKEAGGGKPLKKKKKKSSKEAKELVRRQEVSAVYVLGVGRGGGLLW